MSPERFYARAWRYARREYPDSLDWAKKATRARFLRMRASQFLAEYIWVVYAAGFRVAVLESKWPALRAAYANLEMNGLARMRSIRPALRVIAHEKKAASVLRGVRQIVAEGFPDFKRRLLKEGPDSLAALPGIGPITKDHLARNLGLASVAKDDIWIRRVRRQFGFADKDVFVRRLATRYRQQPGLVDLVIWYYCADAAWKAEGLTSLRAACRGRAPQQG